MLLFLLLLLLSLVLSIIIVIINVIIIIIIIVIIICMGRAYSHPSPGACRDISRTKVARKKEAIAYFSMESALALLISLFINLCVVSVFAKGFYGKGAGDIGLKNAGDYLGERFGSHMV